MRNRPSVSNPEIYPKPAGSFFLAVSLLVIGVLSMPTDAGALVVNVGSVGQLQAALTAAQNNGEGDTINVAAGFYDVQPSGLTFTAAEGFPLAIIGEGANDTTLDGGNTTRILDILNDSYNATVTVRGKSFWRGDSASEGGGLSVNTVFNVTLRTVCSPGIPVPGDRELSSPLPVGQQYWSTTFSAGTTLPGTGPPSIFIKLLEGRPSRTTLSSGTGQVKISMRLYDSRLWAAWI